MPITKATASSVAPAAKGDLVVGSATNDAAVLGVGSNDQVLTADSTTSTGLKWATPSSGATLLTQAVSGNYYVVPTNSQYAGAIIPYYNTTYYVPVYLPTGTADRLVIRTTGSYSGTAAVRMGIYNNTNGFPTTVLVDGGTVSATASNTTYSITISTAVTAGWYWLAVNAPDNGGQNDYWTFDFSSRTTLVNGFIGSNSSSLTYGANPLGYYQTGVSGAFATAGTLVSLEGVFPIVKVRVS